MATSVAPRSRISDVPTASSSGQRAAGNTGSGTGSSDNDSLASEVGRLSEENAHLTRKISEMLGKNPATPSSTRSSSGHFGGGSGERSIREQLKRLERDNRRLVEQNATLERRLATCKVTATGDELWKLKEENRSLRADNSQLSSEIEQLNKVASYVGNRVAKVLVGARRANNYNSQLVGELKRWNRRLEDENHRLYNIIDRLQNTRPGSDMANAVASEASALSSYHNRGRDGNAALVKQLEDQNVKLQEEISKLSDHAISLQNLSSSSGSSGSSGILPAPRTPSNHEQETSGPRRSLTPGQEARKVAEKLRGVEVERRKSRNLSAESLATSDGVEDVERLRTENKKYAEEIERIGADLAFVRNQVTLSKELQDSNAAQTLQIEKLTEAATRVQSLEEANASQAVELERLLALEAKLDKEVKAAQALRADNAQMEEDIFKLADEVERLQPFSQQAEELQRRLAAYEEELADLRATRDSSSNEALLQLKEENVEVQRTLEALAAEKSVLQAQLRELLEERAQLQSQNKDLDRRAKQLQEKANEAANLKAELLGMGHIRGQSATYRAQIGSLRNENEMLTRKTSDLTSQLAAQGNAANGFMRGQTAMRDQTPELEALRAENSSLAEELQKLRGECEELSSRAKEVDLLRAERAKPSGKEQELEALRAQCKDLTAKAQGNVLLTVELTTLRNQVADLRKVEEQFEEQQAALKQLRADKVALQKDSSNVAALRAEIGILQTQVAKAEQAQRAAENALAALSRTSSSRQAELSKEQEDRVQTIASLQKHSSSVAEDLARRESELKALQRRHEQVLEDQEQKAEALKEAASARNELAALRMTLGQEKSKVDSISAEAAELHNLLQTAKTERGLQERAIEGLRAENADLMHRITELLAKNEDQENTLAAVLARSQGNGHAETAARAYSNSEASMRPTTPAVPIENPTYTPEKLSNARNPRYTDSSEEWQTPNGSPHAQQVVQSPGLLTPDLKKASTTSSQSETKKSGTKNGKTQSSKGFGRLFKLGGKKSGPVAAAEESRGMPTPAPVQLSDPPSDGMLEQLAQEQVLSMYERCVDSDDIDGFMAALGYPGFKGPTAADDMEGAFASAKYASRPAAMTESSEWDQHMAHATHELMGAWQNAWQEALGDAKTRTG